MLGREGGYRGGPVSKNATDRGSSAVTTLLSMLTFYTLGGGAEGCAVIWSDGVRGHWQLSSR